MLGLLSIALLWGEIVYNRHVDLQAAYVQANAATLSLAVALREHIEGIVSNADQLLQRLDDEYRDSSRDYTLPEWVRNSTFLEQRSLQVGVIGVDGHLVASTVSADRTLDLSDREHFRVHLNPAEPQPYISVPVIGRGTGKPSIQITRRITRRDGSFAGVGVVSLDPAYFARFFQSVDLGPHGVISLVGRDGVVRARSTRSANYANLGRDVSKLPMMKTLLSVEQGNVRKLSSTDRIDRLYGFAAGTQYPLIVITGEAVEDVDAPRTLASVVRLIVGAALSFVIVWLVYLALRELQRRSVWEARLRQSQKLEAVGQLTAGVAHDFNNILTAIKGNVERTLATDLDDRQRALLNGVDTAATRAEQIVSHLLAYARQQPLLAEAVDINAIVRDTADLLRAGFGVPWIVRCELDPRLKPVMADAAQVETALLNLAVNARDAMPAGGTITFETRLIDSDRTSLPPDLAQGSYVAICVKDTGPGMSPEVAAKAFDPFFTTKERGTGLGLSQVLGLAKQLGGTAAIDTSQHKGTTVTIYLPVADAAPTQAPAAKDQEKLLRNTSPSPSSKLSTVLVADDDPQVREFVSSTLKDEGYEIVEAHDGPTALEALMRQSVDLAVLDISMPGMSGVEAYRRASASGRTAAVLFISGFADPDVIGGHSFLAKPFRRQTLKDRVARIREDAQGWSDVNSSSRVARD